MYRDHGSRRVLLLISLVALINGCGQSDQIASDRAAESATLPPIASPPAAQSFARIDRDRLLAADQQPENWLTTGRDFGKSHYSPLAQINRDTVARLGFAWEYKTHTDRGLEATPIVVDGVMYTSGINGRAYALDARSGAELWAFDPKVDAQVHRKTCCDQVNRGVAVWDGRVYVASLDGRMFALDAATGAVIWEVDTFIDKTRGYSITGAPEIAGTVVVIGNAGGEFDARGYVSAYTLATGKLAWRFFIVPGDPAKGFEHPELELAARTWDPNTQWETGLGGTPWDALVYDPELNLLYVGTGNAAPWNYHARSPSRGDNLFLTSILAINPDTGRLVWHFQEIPGDSWDYTATQPIILTELTIEGQPRKVLMQAPKNGYFYILDRATGEFLSAEAFVPVSWGHVDPETGRGIVDVEATDYRAGPKLVFPSAMGGHNFHRMAYSRDTGLVYIPAIEGGMIMFEPPGGFQYRPGQMNTGVTTMFSDAVIGMIADPATAPPELRDAVISGELTRGKPDPRQRGVLRAWDPLRGEAVWEFETAGSWDRAGVLATGGGLVFHGDALGHFRVHHDLTGEVLKDIEVGSTIIAAPMTYVVDGEQYVAVMAAWGGGGWSFPQPTSAAYRYGNQGRVLAFKLDGGPTPLPPELSDPEPIPQPPPLVADAEIVARGGALFSQNCASCHSQQTRAGSADLRRMSATVHESFNAIVLDGAYKELGMPQWNDVLNAADADAIHAYLIATAWDAYNVQ